MESSDEEVHSVCISRYQSCPKSAAHVPNFPTYPAAANVSSHPTIPTLPTVPNFQNRTTGAHRRPSPKPQPKTSTAPRLETNERILRRGRSPALPPPVNQKAIPKTVAFGLTTKVSDTIQGQHAQHNRNVPFALPSNVPHTLSAQFQALQQQVNEQEKGLSHQNGLIEKLMAELVGLKEEIKEIRSTNNSLKVDMMNLSGTVIDLRSQNGELKEEIRKLKPKPIVVPTSSANRAVSSRDSHREGENNVESRSTERSSKRHDHESSFSRLERQIKGDEKENLDFTRGYTKSMIRFANRTLNRTNSQDDVRSNTSDRQHRHHHHKHRNHNHHLRHHNDTHNQRHNDTNNRRHHNRHHNVTQKQFSQNDEEELDLDDFSAHPVSTLYNRHRPIENALPDSEHDLDHSVAANRYVEERHARRRRER